MDKNKRWCTYMSKRGYVNGYSKTEADRLSVQAGKLNEILYGDIVYPPGSLVLEAGCGVGAQTSEIAKNSPGAGIISVDISRDSLLAAQKSAVSAGNMGAEHLNCDIFSLPFAEKSFDHIFVCFVLEHLVSPKDALSCLLRLLKPGGQLLLLKGIMDQPSFIRKVLMQKETLIALFLFRQRPVEMHLLAEDFILF